MKDLKSLVHKGSFAIKEKLPAREGAPFEGQVVSCARIPLLLNPTLSCCLHTVGFPVLLTVDWKLRILGES